MNADKLIKSDINFVNIYLNDKFIGHKNINCPYYERCLNDHCIKDSNYWICNKCKYEFNFSKAHCNKLEIIS